MCRTVGSSVANILASASHLRAREPIEQRGFPGVGVAHQRDGRKRHRLPLAALGPPAFADVLQLVAELLDPAVDPSAIGFKLRFARSPGADSAAQPRHLDAASGQPRQQIIQLRQFHLQLTFSGAGAPREYVQDQLRSVQDLAIQRALEIALLGGSEFGIEDDRVGLEAGHQAAQLFQLARSDQRGRIRRRPGLDDGFRDACAGGVGQSLQLFERFFHGVGNKIRAAARAGFQVQPNQNRAFLHRYRQIGSYSSECSAAAEDGPGAAAPCAPAGGDGAMRAGPAMERPRHHHRGYGVLENELLLIVGFEHHGILVETLDAARKFHAAH